MAGLEALSVFFLREWQAARADSFTLHDVQARGCETRKVESKGFLSVGL